MCVCACRGVPPSPAGWPAVAGWLAAPWLGGWHPGQHSAAAVRRRACAVSPSLHHSSHQSSTPAEASPEEFFVPYVWSLAVAQGGIPFSLPAIQLFTPTGESGWRLQERGRPDCTVCRLACAQTSALRRRRKARLHPPCASGARRCCRRAVASQPGHSPHRLRGRRRHGRAPAGHTVCGCDGGRRRRCGAQPRVNECMQKP